MTHMVQNTNVLGHALGDRKAIQNVYTYYTFHGVAAAKRPPPIEIVPCVYILDSSPVTWNMAEIGFLYHLCLSKSSIFCTICVSPCFSESKGPSIMKGKPSKRDMLQE